jgi:RimJ/RimL family protein N-acetyltransferase
MVRLECLEKEDLTKIVEWNANKSSDYLLQWAGPLYSYPITHKKVEDYFYNYVEKGDSNIFVYKIRLCNTDDFIGTIELREIDKDNRIGRVCRFLIGEDRFRGKGIGAQVLQEILKIGFIDLKFENITLGVFDFNNGAIKCYENAGFVKEKFLKNIRESSTGYWNSYEMSISKMKWQIKNKFN